MGKATDMRYIVVDGKRYRTEEYSYRSCSEVLVRGPFAGAVFHQDGRPVFRRGICSAFKIKKNLSGAEGMPINPNKSKKNWPTDPETLEDWEPFFEAWHKKKFGEESL